MFALERTRAPDVPMSVPGNADPRTRALLDGA